MRYVCNHTWRVFYSCLVIGVWRCLFQDMDLKARRVFFLSAMWWRVKREAGKRFIKMYDQIYKRINDNLWKDSGCGSELDYVEQSSWILFLKYLDDLEKSREDAAELDGRKYSPIIERKFRWSTWAVPKKNGEKDLAKTKPKFQTAG